MAETFRVLVPGGRLAMTDWIANPSFSQGDRAAMRRRRRAKTRTPDRARYCEFYRLFVRLAEEDILGGARILAIKPSGEGQPDAFESTAGAA